MRPPAYRVYRRRTVAEPSLAQCVLLSLLLHVFLVLLVGTAERGGGRYGDGRLRDIDAALAPFMPDSGYRVGISRRSAPGEQSPASISPAGAPPRPSATPSRREGAPAPAAEPSPQTIEPLESSPLQEIAPAVDSLPRLDRGAPEIVDKAIEEAPLPPLPLETIPRVDLEVPRNVEPAPMPAPSIVIPRETPAPPRPAARPAPPPVEPEKAPVIEEPPPAIQPPMATPMKAQPEAPSSPEPDRKAAPAPPPPLFTPRAPVAAPPAPVAAPPTPVIAPPVVAPVEVAPVPSIVETPPRSVPEAIAPAPAEAPPASAPLVAPPPVPITPAPRVERPAPRPLEPTSTPAPAPAPREIVPVPPRSTPEAAPRTRDVEPLRPSIAPPAESPAAEPAPRLKFGAPEDNEEIFKPRASPPTGVVPPPGQAPRLNLDAANRERAGADIARSNARKGILNLEPPPAEPVSKLGKAIQKASQPDCRDAYAAMGLLAVPFLLKDTVTDTGCRW